MSVSVKNSQPDRCVHCLLANVSWKKGLRYNAAVKNEYRQGSCTHFRFLEFSSIFYNQCWEKNKIFLLWSGFKFG